jgi:predicted nucleic acid-binding protein
MSPKRHAAVGVQTCVQTDMQNDSKTDAPADPVLSEHPGANRVQTPVNRVLDTNIVLDLWVFDEPHAHALRNSVESGHTHWLATAAMREELARVLAYPHIVKRLTLRQLPANAVLTRFDRWAQLQPDAPRAECVCKDPDDQKFIDLAVQHTAALHSKDAQVLCMEKRLARCGVRVNPVMPHTDVHHAPAQPHCAPIQPATCPASGASPNLAQSVGARREDKAPARPNRKTCPEQCCPTPTI